MSQPQYPQGFPAPQGPPTGAAGQGVPQQHPRFVSQQHVVPQQQGPAFPPSGPGSGPRPEPGSPSNPAPIPPEAQRDVDPRSPQFRRFGLPVTTQENLPGLGSSEHVGVVFGVVTRPRNLAHSPEMSFILTEARQDAIAAMVQQARQAGAEGVVGLRFDGGLVSESVAEITAYGTAVRFRR